MASEMVERVKKALFEADAGGDPEWDYTAEALAVIRAMREPTEAMVEAMWAHEFCGVLSLTCDHDTIPALWASAIDAAIAEAE